MTEFAAHSSGYSISSWRTESPIVQGWKPSTFRKLHIPAILWALELQILFIVILSGAELETLTSFSLLTVKVHIHFPKKCQKIFLGMKKCVFQHTVEQGQPQLTLFGSPKHTGKFLMSPKCLKYSVSILYRHQNKLGEFWSFKQGHLAWRASFDACSLASIWASFVVLMCHFNPWVHHRFGERE